MLGLTYVYMPSIPGWVSPNRTPEPEPKPVFIPRHKKTAEYWFKFYMGEDLSEFEEPIPEPAPQPDPQPEPEEDEDEDDEDLIVSWPMTPEEIDAWQNQPISELPPYYGSTESSNKAQSAQADFAAEGLGGAASAACPPTRRTSTYHWPFPTRDTVSLNFAPTQTITQNVPDTTSPRRITLRRHVTAITQPEAGSQHSAFLLHPSAFSKEERPPPNSTEREENRKPPSFHSPPKILCASVVNSKTESPVCRLHTSMRGIVP